MRQIVLDTETTGLEPKLGHRIIEIGCIELIDRRPTRNNFHRYLNPERDIEAGAEAVHGLSREFLSTKPLFANIVDALLEYINGAELVIHNAPFDLRFLDNELKLLKAQHPLISDRCQILDTLPLARKMHPGQRNSLDALCKRYHVDNSTRDLHGALLDARLLADVYLAMTGGQHNLFEAGTAEQSSAESIQHSIDASLHLSVKKATAEESLEHEQFINKLIDKSGKKVWNVN